MPRTNAFATAINQLFFENLDTHAICSGSGDGLGAASTAGNYYLALFTASPTAAGTQTNEANYGNYGRVSVPRADSQWTVSGNTMTNVNAITFPEASSGSNTITHAAIMSAITTGQMLHYFALSSSLAVTSGVTPSIPAGDLDFTEDVTL